MPDNKHFTPPPYSLNRKPFSSQLRFWIIFLALTSSAFSFSQQREIERLELMLNREKLDSLKIRVLDTLQQMTLTKDFNKSLHYNNEYIKLANKTKILLGKGYEHRAKIESTRGYYKEAENYVNLALECYEKTNNPKGIKNILFIKAKLKFLLGKSNEGIKLYKKIIHMDSINGREKELIKDYSAISAIYINKKETDKAIEYLIPSLKLAQKHKNPTYIAFINHQIGNAYLFQKKCLKAREYLSLAEKGFKTLKNIRLLAGVLTSKAITYEIEGKIERALKHHLLALKDYRKVNYSRGIITALQNVGLQQDKLKKRKEALKSFTEAYLLAKKINSKEDLAKASLSLAKIEIDNGNYTSAEKHIAESKKIKKTGSVELLSKAYAKKKKYKKAYEYLKEELNREIKEYEKLKTNQFSDLETKYQTEKKEKENLQLKQEKAEQQLQLAKENQQKWVLGLGLLTSLLVLGVFGYYYRRNQQQKTLIEGLQKELHHRVKNNLSIIDRFVEVLKDEFNEPKFTLKLTELQNRIASINEVHQQLYGSKDVTQLHMKTYIEKLANNVQKSFPNHTINIHKQIDNNLELTSTKSFPLGIIINEFLTNSYKYAFGDSKKGNINIEMTENEQNYVLNLSDSGKGLPEGFDIKADANFGLRIVRLLCMQINATFRIKNENGMQLVIEMPKN